MRELSRSETMPAALVFSAALKPATPREVRVYYNTARTLGVFSHRNKP